MNSGEAANSSSLAAAVWTSDSQKLTLNSTVGSSITCTIPKDSWDSMDASEIIKVRAAIGEVYTEADIKKDMVVASKLTITPENVTIYPNSRVLLTLSGEMSDGTVISDEILNTAAWTFSPSGLQISSTIGKSITVGISTEYWRRTPNGASFTLKASVQGITAQAIVKKSLIGSNSIDIYKTIASTTSGPNNCNIITICSDTIDENKAIDKFADYAEIALVNGENVDSDEAVNSMDSSAPEGNTQETDAVYYDSTNNDPLESSTLYYRYDNNGNIIEERIIKASGEEITAYRYNELNQLTQLTNSSGTTTYTYSPSGLRETKNNGGETTKYYYDGQNVIIETINNNFSARNILGINPIARETNNSTLYYLYNGHADVVVMVDSSGNVVNSYDYDIYGNIKAANELGLYNPIRYAGQYYDDESDLYYLRARYYDLGLMRFISEDTNKGDAKDPLSLNLYVYCEGNPVLYSDIDGHMALPTWFQNIIDGIKAHKAIELYVISNLGRVDKDGNIIRCNYFIRGAGVNGNYGFADLYNIETKEVWEIKPNKATYMVFDKLQQLDEYVRNIKDAKHGGIILGGHFEVTGEDDTVYLVDQYEHFPGMLYYTIKEKEPENSTSSAKNSSTQVKNMQMMAMILMLFKIIKGGGGNHIFVPN